MMKNSLFLSLLVFATSCGSHEKAATSNDQANIQGVWLAETESVNGVKKDVDFQYIFQGNQLSFIDETGKEMKYSFTLDTSGQPRFIVLRPADAPADSSPVSVGYELDGDALKIVVAPPGLRPTEISDKNDQELIVCKRKGS